MSKKAVKEKPEAPAEVQDSQLNENNIEPKVVLTEQDKINFFKSFLADEPFVDTIISLGGVLRLKFRSLTSMENMDIYAELKKLQNAGDLTSDANYITQLTCSRLALTLDSINDVPFLPEITAAKYPFTKVNDEDTEDSYITKRTQVVKNWSVHKLTTIVDSFKLFENKLMALIKEVQTENFWPADK